MASHALTRQSPALKRLWAYLLERFPPVAYSLLVAFFYGSALLVASRLSGQDAVFRWQAPVVMLLLFFHLRIFDEHKDAKEDLDAYPDRLLSQGIVSLSFLRRTAVIAIGLQAGLSASLGQAAFLAWAACFAFTLLMLAEFFVGKWLNQRMLVYAISHNPITPLLGVFAWASTGLNWQNPFGWYLASAALGAFAFELGRKLRLPSEEQAGVSTYSNVYGRSRAAFVIATTTLLSIACTLPLVDRFATKEGLAGCLLVLAATGVLATTLRPVRAKGVEGACTALLLIVFLVFGVISW